MNGFHDIKFWGALVSGVVLLALLTLGWIYRAWPTGVDTIIGGIGVAALLVAAGEFLDSRGRARAHRSACPHCGELLPGPA